MVRWHHPGEIRYISKGGHSTNCGAKCSLGCTSLPPKKLLLTKQLWFTHNIINRTWQWINREGSAGESHLLTKGNYSHMEEKDGKGQSYQYREGGWKKAENGLAWILAHNWDRVSSRPRCISRPSRIFWWMVFTFKQNRFKEILYLTKTYCLKGTDLTYSQSHSHCKISSLFPS